MTHPEELNKIRGVMLLALPILAWVVAAEKTHELQEPKINSLIDIAKNTHQEPVLMLALLAGLVVGILFFIILNPYRKGAFKGASFKRHHRGTTMVSDHELKRITTDKKLFKSKNKQLSQINVCGIPMPFKNEGLHLLVNGATGTGKSVALLAMLFDIFKRAGDRAVILDPEGESYSKFGRNKDKILNPYDERTEGWSFYNEIRSDYDFQRYALSLIPASNTSEGEEWARFGRLIVESVAQKLHAQGDKSIKSLFEYCTIVPSEDLRAFLEGTKAESLFAGSSEASKALTSARFVISEKLSRHLDMPQGDFSIRDWLEDPNGGNLYITWREDQAAALRPLISAWVDVICTSVLSLPVESQRRLWLFVDELASMEKLASLIDALTKGRKKGLRVVAGIQSVSQLDYIYGKDEATILRSCFRNMLVLGGTRADPETCEEMSKGLGDHEVERSKFSRNQSKDISRGVSDDTVRERVVMPSQIAQLPDLTAFVAFAGDLPIAQVSYKPINFKTRLTPFVERLSTSYVSGGAAHA